MTAKRVQTVIYTGIMAWSGAILAAMLLVSVATAHTVTVVTSSPADGAVVAQSPARVTAQFDEELDTKQSTMHVVDAAGAQVSEGDGKVDLDDPDHQTMIAVVPVALAVGTYTVQWHAVLTDGDASDGTFQFSVGNAAAGSTPISATQTSAPAQPSPAPTESTPSQSANTGTQAAGSTLILSFTGLVLLVAVVALFMAWRRRRRAA